MRFVGLAVFLGLTCLQPTKSTTWGALRLRGTPANGRVAPEEPPPDVAALLGKAADGSDLRSLEAAKAEVVLLRATLARHALPSEPLEPTHGRRLALSSDDWMKIGISAILILFSGQPTTCGWRAAGRRTQSRGVAWRDRVGGGIGVARLKHTPTH